MILFNLDSLLGGPIVKYSYMWDPVVNIWIWGRHDDSVYNNIGRQKHDPQMTFLNISSQRCWHKRYFPLPATPPFLSQLFSEFQFLQTPWSGSGWKEGGGNRRVWGDKEPSSWAVVQRPALSWASDWTTGKGEKPRCKLFSPGEGRGGSQCWGSQGSV